MDLQELEDYGKARHEQFQRFLEQLMRTVEGIEDRQKADHQEMIVYYQKSISDLQNQYQQIADKEITTLSKTLSKCQAIRSGFEQVKLKKTENRSLLNSFRERIVSNQDKLMKEINKQADKLQNQEMEFREMVENANSLQNKRARERNGVEVNLLEDSMMSFKIKGKQFSFKYDLQAKKWKPRDTQPVLLRAINEYNIHRDLPFLITTLRRLCQPPANT